MPNTLETREYQTKAVNAVLDRFRTQDRTQLHMAPGSGKTIVALLVKESMSPSLTVLFVPTIQLVHQQFLAWARARSQPFRALAVASGRKSWTPETGQGSGADKWNLLA